MRNALLYALYYLRALPGADGRHAVAAALARADLRLYHQRRALRAAHRNRP